MWCILLLLGGWAPSSRPGIYTRATAGWVKAWSDAAACRGRTATVATAAWETVKEPKGS